MLNCQPIFNDYEAEQNRHINEALIKFQELEQILNNLDNDHKNIFLQNIVNTKIIQYCTKQNKF